ALARVALPLRPGVARGVGQAPALLPVRGGRPVPAAPAQPVALVTGAGRGIGREIALALAREGCHVAVAARTSREVAATAAAVAGLGVRAIPLVLDVTDEGAVTRGVAAVAAGPGPVDVPLNNAGIAQAPPGAEHAGA